MNRNKYKTANEVTIRNYQRYDLLVAQWFGFYLLFNTIDNRFMKISALCVPVALCFVLCSTVLCVFFDNRLWLQSKRTGFIIRLIALMQTCIFFLFLLFIASCPPHFYIVFCQTNCLFPFIAFWYSEINVQNLWSCETEMIKCTKICWKRMRFCLIQLFPPFLVSAVKVWENNSFISKRVKHIISSQEWKYLNFYCLSRQREFLFNFFARVKKNKW